MKFSLLIYPVLFISIISCEQYGTDSPENPYDKGLSFAVEGKFEKADKSFKAALQTEEYKNAARGSREVTKRVLSGSLDREVAIHFFKGVKYANEGKMLESYSSLSKSIRAAPDFADAYYERGLVNARLQYFDNAIKDFSRIIQINVKDAPAYNNRGLVYARGKKDYQKAIADFDRAVEIDPDFAEAYDNRGIAYSKIRGNKAKACADWIKACQLKRCNNYHLSRENGYCD